MTLRHYMATAWSQLTFAARLLAISATALLVAGAAMLLVSTQQSAREAGFDLANELTQELETLPAALAETVVIGDYASLQQQLDRYVVRAGVVSVQFVDSSGQSLQSKDKSPAAITPDWFLKALQFSDVSGSTAIRVGGRSYGSIRIALSAQGLANRAWQRLTDQLLILLLALGLDVLGLWWVLRSGLAPLKRLKSGAEAIADGKLDTRLGVEGSPELRTVIDSFNRMAAVTQGAQERLRQSHADLRRFSEITAHHMQEPARRMASFADLLGRQLAGKLDDPQVQRSLDFIGQQARYQQNLLRDVQLYLAADQPLGPVQRVDTAAVVARVVDKLAGLAAASGAQITVNALPPVWFDARRMGEVFELLMDNALRHGAAPVMPGADPARALHIRVDGARVGNVVRYCVSDNGPGIEAQYREQVFRAFERLQPGGTDSGIGLALVRRIVESGGGRAWIDEVPGGGCSVWFELAQQEGAP